jgi:hypothetical protein
LQIALSLSRRERKWHNPERKSGTAKFIADKLSKAGWSVGWVSAVEAHGQTIFVADAHRDERLKLFERHDTRLKRDGRRYRAAK